MISKYMYIVAKYMMIHKKMLVYTYSVYDITKFGFYVSDRIGIIDILSKKINNLYDMNQKNIILLEFGDIEKSELGDFQILNIF